MEKFKKDFWLDEKGECMVRISKKEREEFHKAMNPKSKYNKVPDIIVKLFSDDDPCTHLWEERMKHKLNGDST